MTTNISDPAWDSLNYAEKNRVLFERQKKMLEEFLERNAISQQQYEKSLHDLMQSPDHQFITGSREFFIPRLRGSGKE